MTPTSTGRLLAFNIVGAGGMAVQLATLALLVHGAGAPVLLSTVLAVEAAILHNFFWHDRWTWRDRPARDAMERCRRLVRFHAANGIVSLAGNLALAALFIKADVDPIVGNIVAVLTCSLVNYAAGDLVVFNRAALFVVTAFLGAAPSLSAQTPEALAGWNAYVQKVEARHGDSSATPFFALDMVNASRWRERAKSGEAVMHEVEPPGISEGKLHHWAGAIYVPQETVNGVLARLQEHAGRESEFYEEVKASKLLERNGDRLRVYLRLYRDAGPVEATYNTEHALEYRRVSGTRATQRSVSTKIAELANAGTPRELEKRPGDDNGFLWRLNAYWRYEQWGDGVLIECESVSLSRTVPFLIRPIANPIVDRIARESLARTLRSLRKFLVDRL